MSYAQKFLMSHGQDCSIKRNPAVSSKISLKRSTRSSRDLGSREAYWEGLILTESELKSGEVLYIGDAAFLIQTVSLDPASGETAFFAAKSNATIQHCRETETATEYNNIIKSWPVINANVEAYGEIVTYQLRQEDPGLLDQTRYIYQVPKSINAKMLDRILVNGDRYQVVSIDDLALPGIVRLQLGVDFRP